MKKIRYTGYLIIGSAQSVNLILKESGAAWLKNLGMPEGSGYVLAVLSVVALAFGAKWLYDKLLWRLIFPGNDLAGKWSYTNHYEQPYTGVAASASNHGEVVISQTPDTIRFTLGNRSAGGASWNSVSVDFDEEGGKLHMVYDVTRTIGGLHKTVTSYEELTIRKLDKVGWLGQKKPVRMTGSFGSLMLTAAKLADLRTAFGATWEPEVGSGTYERIK